MGTVEAWFDALYQKHTPDMRRLAARALGDPAAAEDVVHNVFILLLVHYDEVSRRGDPAGWLYVALRYQIGNELRRAERRLTVSLEDLDRAAAEDGGGSLLEVLPWALKPEERKILSMFYELRMSHREIAEALGCSELACRCRLHRVRQRCGKLLTRMEKGGQSHD